MQYYALWHYKLNAYEVNRIFIYDIKETVIQFFEPIVAGKTYYHLVPTMNDSYNQYKQSMGLTSKEHNTTRHNIKPHHTTLHYRKEV